MCGGRGLGIYLHVWVILNHTIFHGIITHGTTFFHCLYFIAFFHRHSINFIICVNVLLEGTLGTLRLLSRDVQINLID